jgi:hypothetical protein
MEITLLGQYLAARCSFTRKASGGCSSSTDLWIAFTLINHIEYLRGFAEANTVTLAQIPVDFDFHSGLPVTYEVPRRL